MSPELRPGRAKPSPKTRSARTDSTTPASTGAAFPARSAFHQQSAPGDFSSGTRHRTCGFAAGGTASDALSPLFTEIALAKEARPSTIARAFRPGSRGPRAACRLLQSNTIAEHNCPIDRTPLTAPRVAPKRSSWPADHDGFRRPNQPAGRVANAPFEARPAEVSRARGKRWVSIQPLLLSNAIARIESFSPTRSARTPAVANPLRRRYGEPCAAKIPD